jgi:hypothetical protein
LFFFPFFDFWCVEQVRGHPRDASLATNNL